MRIEHVFFDLDRTLWDFDRNSHEALSHIFDKLGLQERIKNKRAFISDYKRINDYLWAEYRKGKIPKEELRMGRFLKSLQKHDVDDVRIAEHYSEAYIALCPHLTTLFPNCIETLVELQKRGKRMHIITNGFSEVQHLKLQKSGLVEYFDFVICSDALGVSKPDSRIFKHAMELAQAKPAESAMIGDHLETDVLGANAVGMEGVLFDPKNEYKNVQGVAKIKDLSELAMMFF